MSREPLTRRASDQEEPIESVELPRGHQLLKGFRTPYEFSNVDPFGWRAQHPLEGGAAMAICVDARYDLQPDSRHLCRGKTVARAAAAAEEVDDSYP
jgi:hypothetical protein